MIRALRGMVLRLASTRESVTRERVLTGVAKYNGYNLADPIDRDEAERETAAIMTELRGPNTEET
jgi:hypothetical protein